MVLKVKLPCSVRRRKTNVTLEEVEKKTNETIKRILGNDLPQNILSLKASDIRGWDSITHIRIMVALEGEFKILFSIPEINGIDSIQELYKIIVEKCKK